MDNASPQPDPLTAALAEALDPRHSVTREKMLENEFLSELTKALWRQGRREVEILRAEVDRGGYDVVVTEENVIRHIQLKSKHHAGKTREVPISLALGRKPSGCVVVIRYNPLTMEIGSYLWFGGRPGEALPSWTGKTVTHTKGERKERPGHRELPLSHCQPLETIDDVALMLFGSPSGSVSLPQRLAMLAAFAPRLAVDACGLDAEAAVSDFASLAYDTGWVRPDFHWMRWIAGDEGQRLVQDPTAIRTANEEELEQVITAFVRGERFTEGILEQALRTGMLQAIADRAGVLLQQSLA